MKFSLTVSNIFLLLTFASLGLGMTITDQNIKDPDYKFIMGIALNGLFEVNNLTLNPQSIVDCFTDIQAQNTVNYTSFFFRNLAEATDANIAALLSSVQQFANTLPEDIKKCIVADKGNAALSILYNITTLKDVKAAKQTLISFQKSNYTIFHQHSLQVHKLANINEQYYLAGSMFGKYAHEILDKNKIQQKSSLRVNNQ